MTWRVIVHPEAESEFDALTDTDQAAMVNAIEKLKVQGDRLGAPHSSSIRGSRETLRELRPRGGRSRWRAFYRRIGDYFLIAAIGPEASVSPAGFRRSIAAALHRLSMLDTGDDKQ